MSSFGVVVLAFKTATACPAGRFGRGLIAAIARERKRHVNRLPVGPRRNVMLYFGARTIIICRPSSLGSASTLAISTVSSLTFLQQLHAELLVGHLAAAETQGHLDLVTAVEKAVHRLHLHVIVVRVDVGPHLDFLDLDGLLFLAGLGGFLLRLVFEFSEIEDLAHRRCGVRRDFDEIKPGVLCNVSGLLLWQPRHGCFLRHRSAAPGQPGCRRWRAVPCWWVAAL